MRHRIKGFFTQAHNFIKQTLHRLGKLKMKVKSYFFKLPLRKLTHSVHQTQIVWTTPCSEVELNKKGRVCRGRPHQRSAQGSPETCAWRHNASSECVVLIRARFDSNLQHSCVDYSIGLEMNDPNITRVTSRDPYITCVWRSLAWQWSAEDGESSSFSVVRCVALLCVHVSVRVRVTDHQKEILDRFCKSLYLSFTHPLFD